MTVPRLGLGSNVLRLILWRLETPQRTAVHPRFSAMHRAAGVSLRASKQRAPTDSEPQRTSLLHRLLTRNQIRGT